MPSSKMNSNFIHALYTPSLLVFLRIESWVI